MDLEQALELFDIVHTTSRWHWYRVAHVKLVRDYMMELNRRLGYGLDEEKLSLIGILHDILKERDVKSDQYIESHMIPWDLNDYVRRNLGILEKFGLDEHFNSDVQLHPLAGGIFLRKEFYIDDTEVLYPIMFHSCPVMRIYNMLNCDTQKMIDLVLLADKLSSNWLRINQNYGHPMKCSHEVPVDLDLLVFGEDGNELNYSLGLYVAKLIGNSKHPDPIGIEATKFYHDRYARINPLSADIKLGGKREWPRRKNLSLTIR